ncbi:MAG TPA: hypothetical protein VHE37_17305 [Nevskiaceae bacterium]|nr:hypothetical protein [Nevskiaceae bacterium]
MALQISKATSVGVDAQYWRIGLLNFHPRTASCQVVMDGYPTHEIRETGAQPIDQRALDLPFEQCGDGDRAAVYDVIKQLPDWTGATDV